jgi:hypothetical protein
VACIVWDAMPMVIGVTLTILFVFITLSFKSVAIGFKLRSMLTVVLTLAWIFGFVRLIYAPNSHALS